nr:unnamed protein product [Spirometra erinaceieuropaei]
MFMPNRINGRQGLLVCSRLLRPFVSSFSNVASPPSPAIGLRDHNINHMFGAYEEVLSIQIHYLRQGLGANNILLFPGPFGSIRTDYMVFLQRLNRNDEARRKNQMFGAYEEALSVSIRYLLQAPTSQQYPAHSLPPILVSAITDCDVLSKMLVLHGGFVLRAFKRRHLAPKTLPSLPHRERTFGDGPTSQHTTTTAADDAATTDNTNEDTPTYLQNIYNHSSSSSYL